MPNVFVAPYVTALTLWHLALGLCIGSFINVCIYRLPRGLAVTGRSHCPSCGTTLGLSDLMPLLSQLALRRRCRYCGAGISWRYFTIELVMGLLLAAAYLFTSLGPMAEHGAVAQAIFLGRLWVAVPCLLAIIVIDFETYTIPDGLVIALVAIGVITDLAYQLAGVAASPMPPIPLPLGGSVVLPIPQSVLGAIVGFGGLWLLGRIFSVLLGEEAMGYGDVKLMGGAGALLGPGLSLLGFFLLAVTLGAVGGIAGILARRLIGRADSEHRVAKTRLPFGPFLAVSLGLTLLYPAEVAGAVSVLYLSAWGAA